MMKKTALISILFFYFTSCNSYQVLNGIYTDKKNGKYFKIENTDFEYLSISGDVSAVLCKGIVYIKKDTMFFVNKSDNKISFLFCDSVQLGIMNSKKSFTFRNEVFKKE